MKRFLAISVTILMLSNLALLFRQARLERVFRSVQEENRQVLESMTNTLASAAEQFRTELDRAVHVESATRIRDVINSSREQHFASSGAVRSSSLARSAPSEAPRDGEFVEQPTPVGSAVVTGSSLDAAVNSIDNLLTETVGHPPSSSHTPEGRLQERSWGPEQVLGPPNTNEAGDIPTAWAPRNANGLGEEWLHVNYDHAVDVAAINIRETLNPGAISRIAAVSADGQETIVWQGLEPTAQAPVDMSFTPPANIQTRSLRVYLDRRRVPGWNEIDSIELVGKDGSRQWATSATASSSFADR